MRIFRTISTKEFFVLMLGETIFGKEQCSSNCYEKQNRELVSMRTLKRHCFCGFLEPVFYNISEDINEIMVELEIPNEQITIGYGDYFSPIYNKFLDGETWYLNSIYGPNYNFRSLLTTRVKEAHFNHYDISNVVKVYFPYYVKRSTELNYINGYNERPFDMNDFLNSYFRILRTYCLKKGINYKPTHLQLTCMPIALSLSVSKSLLRKELLEREELKTTNLPITNILKVIDSFSFYSGHNFYARLDKGEVDNVVKRFINYEEFISLIEKIFVKDELEFNELFLKTNYDSIYYNEKFKNIKNDFYHYIENLKDFYNIVKDNETIVINYLYKLCLQANIV